MRPAGAARVDGEAPAAPSRRRLYLALAGAPVILLVLLVVAWTVDATVLAGQVARNVEVAGRSIGGESEDSLPEVMAAVAAEIAERPVEIVSTTEVSGLQAGLDIQVEEKTYTTTAGALGLTLDEDATLEAALDVGRDDPLFVRPFQWISSFFNPREVPLHYTVSEVQTALTLQQLQGPDLTAPVEPTIQLGEAGFAVVPGRPGVGIPAADVAQALPDAAEAVEGTDDPITIQVEKTEVTPRFTDEEAQQLADQANTMTAQGLSATADDLTVELTAQQLRSWITPRMTDDGLDLALNNEAVNAELPGMFNQQGAQPVNATVRIEGGRPVIEPGRNGVACCGDDAHTRIWEALSNGQPTVELHAEVSEPEWTTEEVEAWGIREPVGGNRAWRNGAEAPGPGPGFTTYHNCCEARVTNIHRIADLVDGAVIPPGGSFSVNDHVGERTQAKGFVVAGAIRDGMHVDEVGGGVSQFATTLFNAAYFAGLDITQYQAHTEYFTRYPRGREATMGYPNPDLVIENTTPYGVLIDTSHTGTSLTVTLWSTPYVTAEQTGISESPSGACTVVTTTRTRTYQDGRTDTDTFRASYRPGEGIPC